MHGYVFNYAHRVCTGAPLASTQLPTLAYEYALKSMCICAASFELNLTELPPQVTIMLGTQDGTEQGSQWLIGCPVVIVAHI